jgi:dTDP-4-dehydrorhamnose reductase
MKILLLGARGMLGNELAQAFSDKDAYEVIAWDREELDITDEAQVDENVMELKPDVIINAAAYTAVDKAESEPLIAYKINSEAVGYLAAAAKRAQALLVHFSTDYVFDGLNPDGYGEDYAIKEPNTVYGNSKKMAEEKILEIAPRYFLIRTQWLFGQYGKNFIETMLRLAGEGKEIRVVDDQFGSPTYAKDLALKVREMVEEERASGIYHVTNSGTCNWYEFAKKIFGLTGMHPLVTPVKSEEFAAPAKRPTYSMLINTKLVTLRTYEEALRAYLVETGRIKE